MDKISLPPKRCIQSQKNLKRPHSLQIAILQIKGPFIHVGIVYTRVNYIGYDLPIMFFIFIFKQIFLKLVEHMYYNTYGFWSMGLTQIRQIVTFLKSVVGVDFWHNLSYNHHVLTTQNCKLSHRMVPSIQYQYSIVSLLQLHNCVKLCGLKNMKTLNLHVRQYLFIVFLIILYST